MVFLAQPPKPNYALAASVVERIPTDLAAAQKRLGLSTKTLALQIGVGTDTAARLLTGGSPTQPTILAALRWLAEH